MFTIGLVLYLVGETKAGTILMAIAAIPAVLIIGLSILSAVGAIGTSFLGVML